MEWGTKNDEFSFRFSDLNGLARSLRTTKRNVLKVSASFHDPLGMISLVTNWVKKIFHLLCQDKLDWDDKACREIEIILRSLEIQRILKVNDLHFMELKIKYVRCCYMDFVIVRIEFTEQLFICVLLPTLVFEWVF